MKRRLSQAELQYNQGEITLEKALQTVASYDAMLKQVGMKRFKEKLWSSFVLTKGNLQEAKAKSIPYSEEHQ